MTINNPKAAAILDLVRKNIGVTTPRGVTSYQEGEAHTAFVTGQRGVHAQLAIRLLDRGRPEAVEDRGQVQT